MELDCLFLRLLVFSGVRTTLYSGNPWASKSVNGVQVMLSELKFNSLAATLSGGLVGGSSSLKNIIKSFSAPFPALVNATTTTS